MTARDRLWSKHATLWRHPAEIMGQQFGVHQVDPRLLRHYVTGDWWDILEECRITLLVSREYEHLAMALTVHRGNPRMTYFPVPHPSGMAVDRAKGKVFMASTRNPNQVLELAPVQHLLNRSDIQAENLQDKPLLLHRSWTFPGCLYMHDLAMVGGKLYAAAAGMNAIVELQNEGEFCPVWQPKTMDTLGSRALAANYLQLNSMAAGSTLARSFFTASGDAPSSRRPGHPDYPVNGRGVVFSGRNRTIIARGLTRPHSARLHRGEVWVDNSGYGEVGLVAAGGFTALTRLDGWTRGLCFYQGIAFVGISRVIPRFQAYAPGLDVRRSHCGVCAVDVGTGKILGSIFWPNGNQIFAVDWLARDMTLGFPFLVSKNGQLSDRSKLFYAYSRNRKGALR